MSTRVSWHVTTLEVGSTRIEYVVAESDEQYPGVRFGCAAVLRVQVEIITRVFDAVFCEQFCFGDGVRAITTDTIDELIDDAIRIRASRFVDARWINLEDIVEDIWASFGGVCEAPDDILVANPSDRRLRYALVRDYHDSVTGGKSCAVPLDSLNGSPILC